MITNKTCIPETLCIGTEWELDTGSSLVHDMAANRLRQLRAWNLVSYQSLTPGNAIQCLCDLERASYLLSASRSHMFNGDKISCLLGLLYGFSWVGKVKCLVA